MRKYLVILLIFGLTSCSTISNNRVNEVYSINDYSKNMIIVDGGTFSMGSDKGGDDEVPIHNVTLSSFMISKYEITQEQYKKVMGNNPSKNASNGNNPVEQVRWIDAVGFCNELSRIQGLDPVYSIENKMVVDDWGKNGYRLPTEAEWEYCARNGKYGNKNDVFKNIDEYAWYGKNSNGITHPVGNKKPNTLGIFDILGNVNEWCWDEYKETYDASNQVNPRNKKYDTRTVYRGGCFISMKMFLTPTRRYFTQLYFSTPYIGFRVARSIQ
jgi:formylglycine-generating enzyme required for sulfatase activity